MKSKSGFPVIETSGEFRVIQIRNTKFKPVRKLQVFCDIATEEQNAAGLFGLVEYQNGTLDRCKAAALHASHFGEAFVVERIADQCAVAEFENGVQVEVGMSRIVRN